MKKMGVLWILKDCTGTLLTDGDKEFHTDPWQKDQTEYPLLNNQRGDVRDGMKSAAESHGPSDD